MSRSKKRVVLAFEVTTRMYSRLSKLSARLGYSDPARLGEELLFRVLFDENHNARDSPLSHASGGTEAGLRYDRNNAERVGGD